MDAAAHLAGLTTEGSRLLEVAAADLGAEIPTCPGWTAGDLVSHVASGWEAFRSIVESASLEAPDFASFASPPEDHAEIVDFARGRFDALVQAVTAADPDQPVWSWVGSQTMAFYQRRAHIETVIHRVDAELGAGPAGPIDPALGIDAVDELFTVLVSGGAGGLPSGSLHLHQTDGDGEFMLDVVDGAIRVRHEHAKGDAALRATGGDLALVVWGRRSLDGLELFGDRVVADQWIALAP